jgi:hypothetical protein
MIWRQMHGAQQPDERHPEVVKDLSARWEAWAKRTHTDQWIGPRRNDWGEVPESKSQN